MKQVLVESDKDKKYFATFLVPSLAGKLNYLKRKKKIERHDALRLIEPIIKGCL